MKTTNLYLGLIQIATCTQKLVFKAIICGEGGPVGVSRGQTPLESENVYHLKRFLEVLVIQQRSILNLPSWLFLFFVSTTRHVARVCVDMHGCAHVCGMNFQNFFWRIESLHQRTLIRILYEFFLLDFSQNIVRYARYV